MRTHASKPNHFGSWVLWDWISSINSTYFSFNIIVSERDTPIKEYRVGTWHSDPRISCWNMTLRFNYTINLSFIITAFNSLLYYFHQAFFIQGITSIDRININSTVSGFQTNHKPHNQITQSHNQVHRELHNIIQGI